MKYFTFKEFEHSNTAIRLKIDNSMNDEIKNNVTELVDNVLDPLREVWGRPIRVTSGFRSYKLNKAVKGASNSHHLKGMAADITTGSKTDNKKLFNLVIKLNLPFTLLIDELNYSWIHISYDKNNLKHLILRL